MTDTTNNDIENYYNLEEFKESNDLFHSFLSRCTFIHNEKVPQSKFRISTMTISGNFCIDINLVMVYQRVFLDKDIAYIESSKESIRGCKKKKTVKYKKKDIDIFEN